jgi:hypothetical protein
MSTCFLLNSRRLPAGKTINTPSPKVEQHQDANGNPFAEPVLVYTNVTGGLGVFAAYNQLKATLRVN